MKKHLTVLQLLPDLNVGGVERGTLEIAAALVADGHRAIVVSNHGRLVDELTESGGEHIDLPVGKKSLLSLRLIPILRKILVENKVDIVHARSRLPAWLGWLTLRTIDPNIRPKWITTVHGPYSVNRYSKIMLSGERVIAISHFIREYIVNNYPDIETHKIRVIHRGVDRENYHRNFQPNESWVEEFERDTLKQPGRKILVFPGRLTRWKGQLDFINLVARLRELDQNIVALIVGAQSDKRSNFEQQLKDAVAAQGLESHVLFLGSRTDLREIFSVADISYSLPNIPEAFGRTTLEALSLGTPVIGFNEGGTGEVLEAIFPAGLIAKSNLAEAVEKTIAFLDRPPSVPENNLMTTRNLQEKTLAIYKEVMDTP